MNIPNIFADTNLILICINSRISAVWKCWHFTNAELFALRELLNSGGFMDIEWNKSGSCNGREIKAQTHWCQIENSIPEPRALRRPALSSWLKRERGGEETKVEHMHQEEDYQPNMSMQTNNELILFPPSDIRFMQAVPRLQEGLVPENCS